MQRVIVLDTETTGLDTEKDHVIEIAIKYGLHQQSKTDVWVARPPIPIPEEVAKIHGFTDEKVANFPLFGEIADDVAAQISAAEVIVGYNPDFDIAMLSREFKLAGCGVTWPKIVICAKRLWDVYAPPPKRSLVAAYKEFVKPDGYDGAHGALADINATAEVLLAQMERFELREKAWSELDPERAKWVGPSNHLIWKDGCVFVTFGKYKDKEVSEMDDWYTNMVITKDFPTHVQDVCRQLQVIRKQRIPMPAKAIALWAKERFQ